MGVATNLLDRSKTCLMDYRENGFAGAQITAMEICEQMNIPAHLKEKRLKSTQKRFSYEAPDEPLEDALKQLEADFFKRVVDSAITSIEDKFQTMKSVKDKFGILWDLKHTAEMPKESLSECRNNLQNYLSSEHESDLNGKDLFQEIASTTPGHIHNNF
ncbi:hypothetical protein EOD39_9753 [Acipenser ruthenus]|uniref:Uncharacterized protein n=1 Tax=Acipenser ruthenus TaxID=7906 RepID=A0A662YUY3_ACIRT|nr:hypothetical protein EOD39_9753 [Acipenser ruthenus]